MPGAVVEAGAAPEVVLAPPAPVVVEGAGVVLPVAELLTVETVPPKGERLVSRLEDLEKSIS